MKHNWEFFGFDVHNCDKHGTALTAKFQDGPYYYAPSITIPPEPYKPKQIIGALYELIDLIAYEVPEQHLKVVQPLEEPEL